MATFEPPSAIKPTTPRFLSALVVFCLVPTLGFAEEFTEAQVIEAALSQADRGKVWSARAEAARAEVVSARVWPNPGLSFQHEQLFDDAGSEQTIALEQPLAISGRRGRHAAAAELGAAAVELENEAERRTVAFVTARMYWELAATRRRVAISRAWLEQMGEVVAHFQSRVEAGESSPYELERVQKEVADIRATLGVALAEEGRLETRLVRFVGLGATTVEPVGEVMPGELPPIAEVADRPDIAAAARRAESSRAAAEAASIWWIPEPTVGVGYRGVGPTGDRRHGFVVGFGITLPFAPAGRGPRLEAEARAAEAEASAELETRLAHAEAEGLVEQIERLRTTREQYQTDGVRRAASIVETARLSYDAGELALLELLDAYRGLVESRLHLVELEAEARMAELQLRSVLGTLAPGGRR